jgi:outer membrane protein OmpA-like peptidoglycan-associated protein
MSHNVSRMTDSAASRPSLPRRALLGAGLAAVTVAAAVALGLAGAVSVPEAQDFRFSRGTTFAQGEEPRLRAHLARLAAEERADVLIVGHTGTQGDETANQILSNDRAAAALRIALDVGLPASRVHATGVAGGAPLPKADGQGDRDWQSSLARVTVHAQVRP